MKVNIGITEKNRQAVAAELNKLLADEHILYNKTRNYHWSIEGPSFMEFHKLYEQQYTLLAEVIDEIAERIRTIGHFAEGRLKELIKLASLDEPEAPTKQSEQIANLESDHETIIIRLRKLIKEFDEDYKDVGSADFITGLLKTHEKMAWMLRSYLR
ncbi:MAG: DNA starvation/stationary phase protection protein [Sphingobacteriales bacterium SCN 48-20]|uniref:Dps family protein n=1 Tax=Terrimonas ferruginea TaxID=249 RepID=UPI00086C2BF9|nr:DNA starvation/stationary phase protection protein [Terrimonas ferruginea]MBN8784344.1 DNA starvation/stationary phase protection protein [Terrimonas ferruginea]ODT92518.1 MAG: DNA starvation/stationary phase protection protein [Sphingobacteriales bacterium SCN 48-20]OJW45780.1 MAG: DNA starvation/stationary phase protection protein [Sphingobacteriales bacterium 48-107]